MNSSYPTPDGFFYMLPFLIMVIFEFGVIGIEYVLIGYALRGKLKEGADIDQTHVFGIVAISNLITWFIGLVIYAVWLSSW